MRNFLRFLFIFIIVVIVTPAQAETPLTPVSTPAALPSYKLGVNVDGGEYSPGVIPGTNGVNFFWPGPEVLDYYKSKGMSVIRLPFDQGRMQPVPLQPLSTVQLNAITGIIEYARQIGMYVILDPHTYGKMWWPATSSYQPIGSAYTVPDADFADFWTRLSTVYKNYPNVILGLMNEPNIQNQTQWKTTAVAAINAIRAVTTTQTILIPGTFFTTAATWVSGGNGGAWAGYVDPVGGPIMYEMHQYLDSNYSGTSSTCVSGYGSGTLVAATNWLANASNNPNGYKAFLGEFDWYNNFGAGGVSTVSAACITEGNALLAYMQSHPAQWGGWAWWDGGGASGNNGVGLWPPVDGVAGDQPQMAQLTAVIPAGADPPILSFSASPNPVTYNTASTLTWSVTGNVTSCTASVGWSGAKSTSGGTQSTGNLTAATSYTLACTGPDGTDTKSVTVNVNAAAAPVVTLTASPNPVAYNTASTLTWTVTNPVTSCTATGDWSGSKAIGGGTESTGNLIAAKSYTLTCTGPGGSGNAVRAVTVTAPSAPVVTLTAAPNPVAYNTASTLTWSVTGFVDTCTATGDWSGVKATTGGTQSTGNLTTDKSYTLTCTGPGGSGNAVRAVTVSPPVGPIPPVSVAAALPLYKYGVNIDGLEYTPGPGGTNGTEFFAPSHAVIDYYKSKKFSVIRLPFDTARLQPTLNGPLSTLQLSYLTDVIEYARQIGMFVILDPHTFGKLWNNATSQYATIGATYPVPDSAFVDFWTKLSTVYKLYPNVMFGIMNEPNIQTAAQWKVTATAAINAIRAVSTTQTILVSGSAFDTAATWVSSGNGAAWAGYVDPSGGPIMYEMHQYLDADFSGNSSTCVTNSGSTNLVAATNWLANAANNPSGYKAFLGEFDWYNNFGAGGVSTVSAACVTEGNALLGYMTSYAAQWGGWTWWDGGGASGNNGVGLWPPVDGVAGDQPQMVQLTAALPSGCVPQTPPPAPILTFSASPNPVAYNTTSTLTWSLSGGSVTSCNASGDWTGAKSISGGSESTIPLLAQKAYTLTCTGTGGSDSKTVTVAVTPPAAPALTIGASPNPVAYNTASTITWSLAGGPVDNCVASGDWSGARSTSGGTASTGNLTSAKSYTLTCTGPGGTDVETVAVSVNLPSAPVVTINTSAASVASGASVDVIWSTTGTVTSCTASVDWSGTKASSGTQTITNITTPRTFTLACTGPGGTDTKSASVTIIALPTVAISANPTTVNSGGQTILNWVTTGTSGATPCTATGSWSGAKANAGPQTITNITANSTYTLTCTGPGGTSAPSSVSVTVLASGTEFITSQALGTQRRDQTWLGGFKFTVGSSPMIVSQLGRWVISGNAQTHTVRIRRVSDDVDVASVSVPLAGAQADDYKFVALASPVTLSANTAYYIYSDEFGGSTTDWWYDDGTDTVTSTADAVINNSDAFLDTTHFTLNGARSFGPVNFVYTLGTSPGLPVVTISANPTTINSGDQSVISWSATNTSGATPCTATGAWSGAKAANGPQTITNITSTSTYTLTCTGPGGTSAPASATVTVNPTISTTLSVDNTSVTSGGQAIFTWSSTAATSCTATGGTNGWAGSKALSGNQTITNLTTTASYTLTCTGASGSDAKTVTVTVVQVPVTTLSASQTTVTTGDSSTLTWSSTNATSCTATAGTNGWAGSKATSGNQTITNLTATADYTLTCSGPGGSNAKTVTITVNPVASTFFIGETTPQASSSTGQDNALKTFNAALSQTGTIQSMSIYVAVPSGQVRLGIYDDTGPSGGPGALKATTPEFTPVTGWNTQAVASQVSMAPGTYWMTFIASSASIDIPVGTTSGISSIIALPVTYGPMPSTFPTVTGTGPPHRSIYATFSTSNPVTVTLVANPDTITSGGPTTLTWTSTNATSCNATGGSSGWAGSKATFGSQNFTNITTTTTFTLACTGASGTSSASAIVTVTTGTGVTAARANDFLNTIGTNGFVRSGGTVAETQAIWTYAGFRIMRVGTLYSGLIPMLQATGTKVSWLMSEGGTPNFTQKIADAKTLAQAGVLKAVEGPNEPGNFPMCYQSVCNTSGLSWLPVARYQRDTYTAVKADAAFLGIPVLTASEIGAELDNVGLQCLVLNSSCAGASAVTLMPQGTVYGDIANTHNYVIDSRTVPVDNQAWASLDRVVDTGYDGPAIEFGSTWYQHFLGYNTTQLATMPVAVTETGIPTTGSPGANPNYNFSQQKQGTMLLNLYLGAYKRGWSFVTVFALQDQTDGGYALGMGFFNPDYTPKLSATYLHNMTTLLADTSSAFTPGAVNYTIPGEPATTHDLLLQKSNGLYELAVWGERATGSDTMTVNFGSTMSGVKVFDPTGGINPISSPGSVSSVQVTTTDHPLIIEFSTSVPPVSTTFSGNPLTVNSGDSSTLTWTSTNATSCTGSGGTGWAGSKALNGSQVLTNRTATADYTLTCTNASGSNAKTVTITVNPIITTAFSASPTTISSGSPSTLTWSSTNATSCSGSGGTGWAGSKALNGSQQISNITATTTYTLSCTGAAGTVVKTATVTVSSSACTGFQFAGNWTTAINQAPSNNNTICVPAGNWTITQVQPYAGLTIKGAGSSATIITRNARGITNNGGLFLIDNADNVTLSDFTIRGYAPGPSDDIGINAFSSVNLTVRRVNIENMRGIGIQIEGDDGGMHDSLFEDIRIINTSYRDNGAHGVALWPYKGTHHCTFRRIYIDGATGNAVSLDAGTSDLSNNTSVDNNTFENLTVVNGQTDPTIGWYGAVDMTGANNNHFTNTVITDLATGPAFNIGFDQAGLGDTGNTIVNTTLTNISDGLFVAFDTEICGNTIQGWNGNTTVSDPGNCNTVIH